MRANDLSNFTFRKVSSGCYRVSYTTERGDYYVARIDCMPMIDETLHAEWAKLKDIRHLASCVRRCGTHYHKNGEKFYE